LNVLVISLLYQAVRDTLSLILFTGIDFFRCLAGDQNHLNCLAICARSAGKVLNLIRLDPHPHRQKPVGTDQLADHAAGVVVAEHHHQESDLGEDAQAKQGREIDPDRILVAHHPATVDDHAQRIGRTEHLANDPGRAEAVARIPDEVQARQGHAHRQRQHDRSQNLHRDPPITPRILVAELEHDVLLRTVPLGGEKPVA